MAMLSMLRLYTIVTAFTAGGFCLEDPDDRSETCTKTLTMVTMEDATELIKQLETIIMGNKESGVIAIHASIQKQEDNRIKPTPTIELATITNRKDVTTSNPTATDDSQQSDTEATSNAQTLTTTSEDNVTSKPNDTTVRTKPRTTASKDEVTDSTTSYDSDEEAPPLPKPSSTTRTDDLITSKDDSYSSTKSYSDSTTTYLIDVTTSTTPEEPITGMSTTSHRFSTTSDWIEVTTVTTAGSSTEFHGDNITADSVQVSTLTTAAEPDIACDTSHFIFRDNEHLDYVQYDGIVPNMNALTACAWVRSATDTKPLAGTLLSYCVGSITESKECQTIHIKIDGNPTRIKVYFSSSENHLTQLKTAITSWSHLCIVKSTSLMVTYVNRSSFLSTIVQNPVPGNGVLILGQSQHGPISGTTPGKQKFKDEGFRGQIDGFILWKRALNASEILGLYQSRGCYCPSEAVVTFDRNNSFVHGKVDTYHSWNNTCNND